MSISFIQADALHLPLADESVQMCVTSPPYYGLRDYGTATWEGGDPSCDHKQDAPRFNGPKQTQAQVSGHASSAESHGRKNCPKCGAARVDKQIGLEETPEQYVAKLVQVFREVRRVLRDDGTLWLNLGDSYARGNGKGTGWQGKQSYLAGTGTERSRGLDCSRCGVKEKDLLGIPWMVAFALRADGWYLRSDIIWAKPNPMPESVTDRPTKAHEYLFLLAKSDRYYYDADAVKEPCESGPSDIRKMIEGLPRIGGKNKGAADPLLCASGLTNIGRQRSVGDPSGRNRRSVWTIATQPCAAAHFATFPPKLIEPCIKAGSRKGDTVLDPFNGAGTTGLVCWALDRSYVGTELNPAYIKISQQRLAEWMRPSLRGIRWGDEEDGEVTLFGRATA